ncbi:hypothetical protein [Acetobacter sp.]|uniref:hypothetical protein n=1 Tax=Acetobacter sp. TaxID=440 RepID=UPI0039E8B720
MSFLGVISSINSALGTQAFTLGNIVFGDAEVPSQLTWGGYQATDIFRQAGGGKTVVLNGYYDQPLAWEGIFRGSSALQRAQTLDAMARSGNIYPFSGGGISRNVVVTSFEAAYTQKGTIIPYRIFCEIIPSASALTNFTKSALISLLGTDASSALSAITGTTAEASSYVSALSGSASSYLGQITPLANLLGSGGSMSLLSTQISGISTQAGALSSLASNADLLNFQNQLTVAQGYNDSVFSASDTELNSIAANSQGNFVSSPSSLLAATAYSGLASTSALNSAYLTRMQTNISAASK